MKTVFREALKREKPLFLENFIEKSKNFLQIKAEERTSQAFISLGMSAKMAQMGFEPMPAPNRDVLWIEGTLPSQLRVDSSTLAYYYVRMLICSRRHSRYFSLTFLQAFSNCGEQCHQAYD